MHVRVCLLRNVLMVHVRTVLIWLLPALRCLALLTTGKGEKIRKKTPAIKHGNGESPFSIILYNLYNIKGWFSRWLPIKTPSIDDFPASHVWWPMGRSSANGSLPPAPHSPPGTDLGRWLDVSCSEKPSAYPPRISRGDGKSVHQFFSGLDQFSIFWFPRNDAKKNSTAASCARSALGRSLLLSSTGSLGHLETSNWQSHSSGTSRDRTCGWQVFKSS